MVLWVQNWLVKKYRRYFEITQAVNEGDLSHDGICLCFWDGSKYRSRVKIMGWPTFFGSKILRWLKIRREIEFDAKLIRILRYLRIFKLKKVGHLRILTRDRFFEQKLKGIWSNLLWWPFELSQSTSRKLRAVTFFQN